MRLHSTILCLLLLISTGSLSLAQHRQAPVSLPAYNQIKPASRDIYDRINPGGTGNQSVQGRAWLFDYPDSEATYIIDSKIVRNAVVRRVQPGLYIDSISVSQPNDAGKRLIRSRLSPKRP